MKIKYQILTVNHNGYPLRNNENAVLLCTGMTHHVILVRMEV